MDLIPYSLCSQDENSNGYYNKISKLASQAVDLAYSKLEPIISSALKSEIIPASTPIARCCLELLLLGIYTRRGIKVPKRSSAFNEVKSTFTQLRSSRDYTYQMKYLAVWVDFLTSKGPRDWEDYWGIIKKAVDDFEFQTQVWLQEYTKNVDNFITANNPISSVRADDLLCSSPAVEYHINMLGAEILNNLLYEDFSKTKQKLVVLPGCLRDEPLNCKAKVTKVGYKCQQCNSKCQVNLVTDLGNKYGFEVVIIIHQSALNSYVEDLSTFPSERSVGIVGVACVLALLEGGYLLIDQDIPAQCVVLDYCGCVNHWHPEGLTTRVNIQRLLEIVGRKDDLSSEGKARVL